MHQSDPFVNRMANFYMQAPASTMLSVRWRRRYRRPRMQRGRRKLQWQGLRRRSGCWRSGVLPGAGFTHSSAFAKITQ